MGCQDNGTVKVFPHCKVSDPLVFGAIGKERKAILNKIREPLKSFTHKIYEQVEPFESTWPSFIVIEVSMAIEIKCFQVG